MQDFKKPPLHFMGNKRNLLKRYKELLQNLAYDGAIHKDSVFYDVFGGSGLLAHHTKAIFPQNEVIYNDYDDYALRLEKIEKTEFIRKECVKIIGEKVGKDQALSEQERQKIISFLDGFDENELDCMTLSAYFCFGGCYYKNKKDLFKNISYNRLTSSPLNAQGYLEGVKRVQMDFKELLKRANESPENAFLILDPPYLQTKYYAYASHFTLKNFIYLFENIKSPFVLFSSERSDILEFLEVFQKFFTYLQGFSFDKAYLNLGTNLANKNFDYMIYKCKRNGIFDEL